MSSAAVREQLTQTLEPPLAELGLDLEGIEVTRAGKRAVLRVAVDQDGGVTDEDVVAATRAVSRTLDAIDTDPLLGAGPYTLEVGSRGVSRPLTLPRHWRRNTGRLVKVSEKGGETFTGRVTHSDEDGATLDVAGQPRRVRYADVGKARVQVELTSRDT